MIQFDGSILQCYSLPYNGITNGRVDDGSKHASDLLLLPVLIDNSVYMCLRELWTVWTLLEDFPSRGQFDETILLVGTDV